MALYDVPALKTFAKTFSDKKIIGAIVIFALFVAIGETVHFVSHSFDSNNSTFFFLDNLQNLPVVSHLYKAYPYWAFALLCYVLFVEIAIFIVFIAFKIANKKKRY